MKEAQQLFTRSNLIRIQIFCRSCAFFYFFSCKNFNKKLGPWQNLGKNIVANILRVRAFTGLFWKGGRCEVALGGSDTSFTQKPLPIQASSETSRSSVRNKTARTLCIWEWKSNRGLFQTWCMWWTKGCLENATFKRLENLQSNKYKTSLGSPGPRSRISFSADTGSSSSGLEGRN